MGIGILSTSCGSPPVDDVPIQTGTDKLPGAPNQGTAPGQIDSSGNVVAPQGNLPMPGTKGGK